MSKAILLRKVTSPTGPILMHTDQDSFDRLGRVKEGATLRVTSVKSRSPQQHRLFFALLGIAFDNQVTDFRSVDELREAILIEAGFTERRLRLDGRVDVKPKSIAYDNMAQDDFNELFKMSVELICTHIMPGTDPEELLKETAK